MTPYPSGREIGFNGYQSRLKVPDGYALLLMKETLESGMV
jgi:hypothetical protein